MIAKDDCYNGAWQMKVLYDEVKKIDPDEQKNVINNFKKEIYGKLICRADGGCIATNQWGWKIKAGKR